VNIFFRFDVVASVASVRRTLFLRDFFPQQNPSVASFFYFQPLVKGSRTFEHPIALPLQVLKDNCPGAQSPSFGRFTTRILSQPLTFVFTIWILLDSPSQVRENPSLSLFSTMFFSLLPVPHQNSMENLSGALFWRLLFSAPLTSPAFPVLGPFFFCPSLVPSHARVPTPCLASRSYRLCLPQSDPVSGTLHCYGSLLILSAFDLSLSPKYSMKPIGVFPLLMSEL